MCRGGEDEKKKKKKDEEEYFSGHIFQVSTVIWVDYIIYSAPFYSPTYLQTEAAQGGPAHRNNMEKGLYVWEVKTRRESANETPQ